MLLHKAIEAMDVPVFLVGLDRRVEFANSAAHRLLGYGPGALKGMPMTAVLAPRRQGELRNFDELAQGGAARRFRTLLRSDDGLDRQVSLTLAPCLDDNGRLVGITARADSPQTMGRESVSAPAQPMSGVPPVQSPSGVAPVGPKARARSPLADTLDEDSSVRPLPMNPAESSIRALPPLPPSSERQPVNSEQRITAVTSADAPRDLVLDELHTKLQRIHSRFAWLEQRLSETGEALSSPEDRGKALRISCELRVLVERSLELAGEARHRRDESNGA